MARKFPHQTPRFGTKHAPKADFHWQDNFYYLWWSYLKRNEGYLEACKAKGEGAFAELYLDFGDVRGDSFKEWWMRDWRGARLFAEPSLAAKERILLPGDSIPSPEESFTATFPLTLSKRAMIRYFSAMLKNLEHHDGRLGVQDAKHSKAKYQVQGNPTIESLKLGLEVYDLKMKEPNLRLWQIGLRFKTICPDQHFVDDGSKPKAMYVDNKNVLGAAVGRYLKKTQQSIENTGLGIFP